MKGELLLNYQNADLDSAGCSGRSRCAPRVRSVPRRKTRPTVAGSLRECGPHPAENWANYRSRLVPRVRSAPRRKLDQLRSNLRQNVVTFTRPTGATPLVEPFGRASAGSGDPSTAHAETRAQRSTPGARSSVRRTSMSVDCAGHDSASLAIDSIVLSVEPFGRPVRGQETRAQRRFGRLAKR